ncbi:MAG: hypothetical protein N0C84_03230 [Candidatus Thiodiazotropha taylori]|uniref:Uncharacterized protein n=1 Tax=Candidatus Thiodiazotropha taylori TaxID=2792791 RepID=A0A9E4KA72_9GAMM|nr:hypothetical protein [Candidatus Thiodiazotropha taylori]MCG7945337.1 hypothetical protein [Candidatus Thiodiazotropha taylori]MCW4255451.1 hypothetical protein [Candidatus Thiodiazotropha taylori]MCW4255461.1 hypothetical protein [Candidatus Thiodiazotropha taylori]
MNTLYVKGEPEIIIGNLFSLNEEGHIAFGLSARSLEPADITQLESSSVDFRDYLMEGFVKFSIRLSKLNDRLKIEIELFGSNRDEHIVPHVEFYISQAGYQATEVVNA